MRFQVLEAERLGIGALRREVVEDARGYRVPGDGCGHSAYSSRRSMSARRNRRMRPSRCVKASAPSCSRLR